MNGPAPALLAIARSAPPVTVVVAVAVLFAAFESAVVDVTLAVLEMVPVAAALTFTTRVNVAEAPAVNVAMFAVAVPVPPTAGVVSANAGPEVCIIDTKVVFAGTASVSETVSASLGPLLVSVNV